MKTATNYSTVADATRDFWDDRARGLKHHGYNQMSRRDKVRRLFLSTNWGTICTLVEMTAASLNGSEALRQSILKQAFEGRLVQ